MTAVVHGRPWRLLRVGVLSELAYRTRLVVMPMTLLFQLFLYDRLWTAVFAHTATAAGMNVRQTVTYSLLALLLARVRWNLRNMGTRDNLGAVLRDGTVIYWFLRPMSPSSFYLWRQAGDMVYGGSWAVLGYVVLLASGVVVAPSSVVAGVVFGVSAVLGQALFLFLGQIADVCVFWLMSSTFIVRAYAFAQDLLAGVFIPLAFLPTGMRVATQWLPFSFCVNVPLQLYVGTIPLRAAPGYLAGQLVWLVVLVVVGRLLWARAALRLNVQGG
jgi:ABC-2 type transport system permease protein